MTRISLTAFMASCWPFLEDGGQVCFELVVCWGCEGGVWVGWHVGPFFCVVWQFSITAPVAQVRSCLGAHGGGLSSGVCFGRLRAVGAQRRFCIFGPSGEFRGAGEKFGRRGCGPGGSQFSGAV